MRLRNSKIANMAVTEALYNEKLRESKAVFSELLGFSSFLWESKSFGEVRRKWLPWRHIKPNNNQDIRDSIIIYNYDLL